MGDWTVLWKDDFAGPEPSKHWVGGQLRPSAQVKLRIKNGLHVEMAAGGTYASGGLITALPIDGDFAAEVAFTVTAPQAGSTLELAAIQVAPPAATILNPQTQDEGAFVFDVHGTPPYVSSEFDENDGWRIGWNSQPAQFKELGGELITDNEHNQYGRPMQPDAHAGPTEGWLWIERTGGHRWRARGRLRETDPWIELQPAAPTIEALDAYYLDGPVHLRLGAKHWIKPKDHVFEAPANTVVFKHFRVYKRTGLEEVPPAGTDYELRLWLGWRRPDIDWPAFRHELGRSFLPATWRVMPGYGLRTYVPSIFRPGDDGAALAWPDEIALLAYDSRSAYELHKKTPQGKAYSAMHGKIFDFETGPRKSRSAWAEIDKDEPARRRLPRAGGAHFTQPQAHVHVLLISAVPGLASVDLLQASAGHPGEAAAWCVQGMGLLWLAADAPLERDAVAGSIIARWPGVQVHGWHVAQPVAQLPAAGLAVSDDSSWQFCEGLTEVQA